MISSFKTKTLYILAIIFAFNISAGTQCADPDLEGLSWAPVVPGTTDQVRLTVAREYPNECAGLEAKGDVVVDHDDRTITIYFDQFCNDTIMCAQVVHCDTAEYVIGGLQLGEYSITVLDTNATNQLCDSLTHMEVLERDTIKVREVVITSDSVIAKPGTNQCIPFTFDGFHDVNTFQASISWDTFMLRYDTVRNIEALNFFSENNFALNFTDDLRVIWFDFDVDGESLPDGTTLFEVCFDLIGEGGDTTDVFFNSDILNPEIEDVNGDTLAIVVHPGQVIISEDRYPECADDTSDILCEEWVMDTVMSSAPEYCQSDSGYFNIELIDWRGWQLVKIERGYIIGTGPLGEELFFACDGEFVGKCTVGGFAGAFCLNPALSQDTSLIKPIWSCGESLPGCYTTSSGDILNQANILQSNLTSGTLMIKNDFIGEEFEILNTSGQRLTKGILGSVQNVDSLSPGVYWIRSGRTIESFVITQ